jgi:hypothetical protein
MAMELPGIYVRSDTDEMFVFDHVEAKVIGHDNTGVTLDIANSTKFDAKVTIFAETALEAAQPLGCTAFLKWPKYDVKAGASRRIIVK